MLILIAPATISKAHADSDLGMCGPKASILNENENLQAFDKREGGKDRRLHFRLVGREPCSDNECKLEIVRAASGTERMVASVNLTRRDVSFCAYEAARVEVEPEPRKSDSSRTEDGALALNKDCAANYLLNSFSIKLNNALGAFSSQLINVEYMYLAAGRSVSLDECSDQAIVDGVLRRKLWIIPLDDGAAASISEIDVPEKSRVTDYSVWLNAPFAVTTFGEKRM